MTTAIIADIDLRVVGRVLEMGSGYVLEFGHALRDSCNYVHPAEQLAHRFEPEQHTARMGFQVVVAAAEDLAKGAGNGQG